MRKLPLEKVEIVPERKRPTPKIDLTPQNTIGFFSGPKIGKKYIALSSIFSLGEPQLSIGGHSWSQKPNKN